METKTNNEVLNESVNGLVKRINEGIATEQESGFVLKQLQISIATGLLNDLSEMLANLDTLKDLNQRLTQRFEDLIVTEVDMMDIDTVMKLMKELHNMKMEGLEFQRKLIQGKSIYDFQTLSEEEKLVVQLMNSFSSLEEKQEFLQIVKEKMGA